MTQELVIDLKNILLAFKKHLVLILIATILLGSAFFLFSKFVIKPVYESKATLIINVSTDKTKGVTQSDVILSQSLINTYAIILKGDSLLSNVISELDLNLSKGQLAQEITVKGVGTTSVLTLSVEDADPETARAIADKVISLAQDEINRTVNVGNLVVVSPPAANTQPVSPNVSLLTLIGLLSGFLVSGFFAVMLEMFNDKLRSEDDITGKLGFAVIGVIPDINRNRGDIRQRWMKELLRQNNRYY